MKKIMTLEFWKNISKDDYDKIWSNKKCLIYGKTLSKHIFTAHDGRCVGGKTAFTYDDGEPGELESTKNEGEEG